jgi:hypothetical protein
MDRRDPGFAISPSGRVLSHLQAGLIPYHQKRPPPLRAEGRPFFRSERSDPRPDSSPNRPNKKFHTGLTE